MGLRNKIGRIDIRNTQGQSWSSYWTPQIPTGLLAIAYNETRIDLYWTNVDITGDGVSIERSTNGIDYSEVETVALGIATYSDTTCVANTLYYFRVKAYKGSSYSDTSSVSSDLTYPYWWLGNDIPSANVPAAYQPVQALSLANSYINKANPGTYNAFLGVVPDWSAIKGWDFNGVDMYLKTGLVPVSAASAWSMITWYNDFTEDAATISCVAGIYETSAKQFYIGMREAANGNLQWANGSVRNASNKRIGGFQAFIGNKAYIDCTYVNTITAGTGAATYDIYIGAMHYTTPMDFFDGNIKGVAVYNTVLTEDQLKAVCYNLSIKDGINWENRLDYVYKKKLAALLCWNMSTFVNAEGADPDIDPDTFAPTDLDVDNWLDACVAAGVEVAYLTVKHHDGFMLWCSDQHAVGYDPYTIERTTWYAGSGIDITDAFVNGCNARGIKPGIYFSIWDKTHETRTGTDETTDAAAYIAMIEAQLTELLTNYGTIHSLWFDAWAWHVNYIYIFYDIIKDFIRNIDPDCLIIVNDHFHPSPASQIECYETAIDGGIAAGNRRLSEEVQTMRLDGIWFHNNTLDQTSTAFMSAAALGAKRDTVNSRRGLYNIGLQVDRSGHLSAAQIAILEELGTL
ncbi:MAG TPA: alpha-L-fucosidase [archaeon]|nr:alpha-L-fucosidase [archaeon]